MQACYGVLDARPQKAVGVRGLMSEINAAVAPGALTKRGEPRSAAAYVREVLGGCRAWCESRGAACLFLGGRRDECCSSERASGGDVSHPKHP